jgi:SNF2 family DNA or RNA helicase
LRLQLTERGQWLSASGELRASESEVLSLVDALRQRAEGGRFVALGDDRYLALSTELQQHLSALETTTQSDPESKQALRLPTIALGFVSPWLRSLREHGGLKLDKRTAKQLARIEGAYDSTPQVPATFEAELRAYQVTGFEFLSRLSEFGAGACLADDMGLGKTPMTLALLVARAKHGPALVVAPTSVRANWFDEGLRFAPSLRMRRLDGAERVELDSLGPFDVLVCSYTVMTQRIEQLETIRWATLVLDEAQAIKNGTTLRAKSAQRLVADARVALTGTPVENHLGDLHGIMSFLNPGLLGTAKQFEIRFGKPIQRALDPTASAQLRNLIAPFVLRRRKAEVLRELPARTEITLRVEPEPSEQAFSEALRRDALRRLQAGDSSRAGSAISILAEITRLRRAACHPQLVDRDADVGAAKLERVVELCHELRDGGHRALCFSQFVDFLKIVRERLQREGFSMQYLDGSTPEAARKKAVTAFQAGEGDLFLISLKAGGFGLNLTAADYVLHLDPWWNPAVEAQASDRAHRIGQERPVTIYRLVNAASIEERVLSLHERKRALAEDLLKDTGEATRLDPETLMSLLEGA